jgi:hypothetical protein
MNVMFSVARGRQFLQYVVPGVVRPLRVLWNQIIGFFFVVLAVWAAPRSYRSFRDFNGDLESLFRLLLTASFVFIMGGFGIYSFWRARRASRS